MGLIRFLRWLIYVNRRYKYTFQYYGLPFLVSLILLIGYISAFSLSYIFEIIFIINSYTILVLIGFILLSLTTAITLFNYLKPYYYIALISRHEAQLMQGGRVRVYEGAPGTGKTLTMTYDAVFLAKIAWLELRLKYLVWISKIKKYGQAAFSNDDERKIYLTIKDTIDFYNTNSSLIPLLFSTYPIEAGGKRSAVLTKEHFLQNDRLPESAVCVCDESADFFDCKRIRAKITSKNEQERIIALENEIIAEMTSKERHFGDWYLFFAEQDNKENLISIRRVVSVNRCMKSFSRVCEPSFYIWAHSKIADKLLKKNKPHYLLAKLFEKLTFYIHHIGFFKIAYKDRGNVQKDNEILGEGNIILPKHLPFKYESRCFRFKYKALSHELKLDSFDSLYL